MDSSKLLPLIANSWNTTGNGDDVFGQSVNLSYTFLPGGELPIGHSVLGFASRFGAAAQHVTAFTPTRIDAAFRAMAAWSAVANIHISAAPAGTTGDIAFASLPSLPYDEPGTAGFTFVPKKADTLPTITAGQIFLNDSDEAFATGDYSDGTYAHYAFIHEIGHALGLKHPFSRFFNGAQQNEGPYFTDPSWNSTRYTAMAYQSLGPAPFTPMLYDIAAIQWLYGANAETNAEDGNVYSFTITNGWPVQAIWDAGGSHDVIFGGNESANLTIDLNPGGKSYYDTVLPDGSTVKVEIDIAFTPLRADGSIDPLYESNFIENAIGGSGHDSILGNDGANRLEGRGGVDWIHGGSGDDVLVGGTDVGAHSGLGSDFLDGGLGHDTYVYQTGDGQDVIDDEDGDGVLSLNGVNLVGEAFTLTPHPIYGNRRAWRAEINGQVARSGKIKTYGRQAVSVRTHSYSSLVRSLATFGVLLILGTASRATEIVPGNIQGWKNSYTEPSLPQLGCQTKEASEEKCFQLRERHSSKYLDEVRSRIVDRLAGKQRQMFSRAERKWEEFKRATCEFEISNPQTTTASLTFQFVATFTTSLGSSCCQSMSTVSTEVCAPTTSRCA